MSATGPLHLWAAFCPPRVETCIANVKSWAAANHPDETIADALAHIAEGLVGAGLPPELPVVVHLGRHGLQYESTLGSFIRP